MKRQFIRMASALALATALLPTVGQAQAPSYTFSPVNQYDINLTASYWNPIIAYVSEKSGVNLKLKIGRTSADTTSYVLTKEVEFVFTNHLFTPEREQLGWKVFGRRQSPALQGQIVVPADSPITDLAQLKGQEVAFAGPEAFIVYKVPYAHLLSKGIPVKVVFTGNQTAAFAQLFSGKVMASGANSQLVEGYSRRENKKFRVLWSSEPRMNPTVEWALDASQEHRRCCGAPRPGRTVRSRRAPGGRKSIGGAVELRGSCSWRSTLRRARVARASEVLWSSETRLRASLIALYMVARASEVLWSSESSPPRPKCQPSPCRKSIGGAVELRDPLARVVAR